MKRTLTSALLLSLIGDVRMAASGEIYTRVNQELSVLHETAFAAARVAKEIRDRMMIAPELNGARAIQEMLKNFSNVEPLLRDQVQGGRVYYSHPRDREKGCGIWLLRFGANLQHMIRGLMN